MFKKKPQLNADGYSSEISILPKNDIIDEEYKLLTLEESEARYRRLFETAKDGILILDGDTGRIVDANPFLQDMLGYSERELIGSCFFQILLKGTMKNLLDNDCFCRQIITSEKIP